MKKILLAVLFSVAALSASARMISDIENTGSWYRLYDEQGKMYKTISTSTGELVGFSANFYILRTTSWYKIYSPEGKLLTTLSISSIGQIVAIAGDTFTARSGSWTKTYSKEGKLLHTR